LPTVRTGGTAPGHRAGYYVPEESPGAVPPVRTVGSHWPDDDRPDTRKRQRPRAQPSVLGDVELRSRRSPQSPQPHHSRPGGPRSSQATLRRSTQLRGSAQAPIGAVELVAHLAASVGKSPFASAGQKSRFSGRNRRVGFALFGRSVPARTSLPQYPGERVGSLPGARR